MCAARPERERCLEAEAGSPLIGVFMDRDGQQIVRYFSNETEAEAAISVEMGEDALALVGAWSDLDWEDMERQLDRIRHESRPSPPLSL